MLPAHRGRVCVFSCNSTARGGTPFPLGRRADAQKGTYWGHINSPEMSPGDISPYKKYFANLIVYLKRIDPQYDDVLLREAPGESACRPGTGW